MALNDKVNQTIDQRAALDEQVLEVRQ